MEKAAFLDLDKTLYDGFIFYDWANFLRSAGVFSLLDLVVLDETIVLYEMKHITYIEASERIAKGIAEILKEHKISEINAASEKFVEKINGKLYNYTKPLIEKLKEQGFRIVLVTNEPDFLAEMIKAELSSDDALGIEFGIENGSFINEVKNDVSSKYGKAIEVKKYANEKGISLEDSIAIGDSEGDIEMLKSVGKGILINESHIKLEEGTEIIVSSREMLLSLI